MFIVNTKIFKTIALQRYENPVNVFSSTYIVMLILLYWFINKKISFKYFYIDLWSLCLKWAFLYIYKEIWAPPCSSKIVDITKLVQEKFLNYKKI
jgi:hypothetical protein